MEKLSVCITTFNSGRTLRACLESVKWADEIIVLDSFSSDDTLEIAQDYPCRIFQNSFMGYSKQKQMVLDAATNQWALLLDSDEALTPLMQERIQEILRAGPTADGYEFPRLEQMFWRMISPKTRMNYFLRLFNRKKTRISTHTIHESPVVDGNIERIHAFFYHYGEKDLHTKIEKLNAYSSGSVKDKVAKGKVPNPLILVFYPPLYFMRLYIFKRNFLNGWAGFIVSVTGAFYAFAKYAKLYEHYQRLRYGESMLPQGAPAFRAENFKPKASE